MKSRSLVLLLVISLVLLAVATTSAQDSQTLTIFAASSLTNAFEAIATDFEAAHASVDVQFNFAGSSDLAAQLAEGAPADVFASANSKQLQTACKAGRIAGNAVVFAHNRLVLIVPADNPAGITTLHDLANAGIQLIVATEGVPVRDYTDTLLERLAADTDYGANYRDAVLANIVSEEQNVRQVAGKIALGEGDAAFVYSSDVTPDIQDQVIALTIADELNNIATYPIALTNDSAQPELAQAFVDYLLSDAGQATLVHWHFIPIREQITANNALEATSTPEATPEGQVTAPKATPDPNLNCGNG